MLDMITFDPQSARAGQTNILVTIIRRPADLEEPVKVRFLTKKDQHGNFVRDCAGLGNDPDDLQDNEYIKKASEPTTSGGNRIEVRIGIADVNTPNSFSKIYVENGDGEGKFLSEDCFEVRA
jgi:hypothetical protein